MATALVALATTTLASSSATVTFSSISGSYRDLVLVCESLNSTGNKNLLIRFNSDTSSSYPVVYMSGDGSATASATQSNTYMQLDSRGYGNASTSHNHIVNIMDYAQTDKEKTVLIRANNAALGVDALAGRWAKGAAITTIQLFYDSANINAGSTFSLYGVSA